jgi:hypothetical protein
MKNVKYEGFLTTVCIIIRPESALNFEEKKKIRLALKISMDEEMERISGR